MYIDTSMIIDESADLDDGLLIFYGEDGIRGMREQRPSIQLAGVGLRRRLAPLFHDHHE